MLWEIGEDGCDVRVLRARLDLDSGYLSRLLRSLEADGLVTVGGEPSATGGSAPPGSPSKGREERADARPAQRRARPLAARSAVRAPARRARRRRWRGRAAAHRRAGRDRRRRPRPPPCPALPRRVLRRARPALRHGLRPGPAPPRATRRDAPAGRRVPRRDAAGRAGRLRRRSSSTADEPAEIKRMWVAPATRGPRRRPPHARRARDAGPPTTGAPAVRLETNRSLTEAIAMYRSSGYGRSTPSTTSPTPTTGSRSHSGEPPVASR